MEARWAVRPGPQAPGQVRRGLVRLGSSMDTKLMDWLQVLVSELVTNSVRHAGLDAREQVQVTVRMTGDRVQVEVADPGRGFAPIARPLPTPDAEGGWGLFLLDKVSDRWGVTRGDRETRVWFELSRETPPP